MEFAETLMLVSVVGRHLVGKSEEEEPEGLARDKVEMRFLGVSGTRLGCSRAARGLRGLLHLFELVHDGRMKFVFVGEVVLKVAVSGERFRTEGHRCRRGSWQKRQWKWS
jgi:hypothetical protein